MKIFVLTVLVISFCCTSWGQKTPMQLAVDGACLKIYEESQLGKQAYRAALEDFKKSAAIENYKIESNDSKDALRQERILDPNENMLPPLIMNALKANLKGHDSFDAYLAAIVEADRQKKLNKQKTVKSGK